MNKIDYNGRTALHLAAAHSNEECVQVQFHFHFHLNFYFLSQQIE